MQDPQNYAIIDGRIPPPSPGNPGGVGFTGYFRTLNGTYTGVPLSNYQIAQDYTPRRRQDNDAAELTAEWSATPANKVTSITSWDEGKLFNPEGTDGAPYEIWSIPYIGKTRQFTQDLRLTSTGDAALKYILGAYYQHEIIFNSTENQIFTDPAFNTYNNYKDCAASSFGAGTRLQHRLEHQSRLRLFQFVRPNPQQLGDLHRRQLQTGGLGHVAGGPEIQP